MQHVHMLWMNWKMPMPSQCDIWSQNKHVLVWAFRALSTSFTPRFYCSRKRRTSTLLRTHRTPGKKYDEQNCARYQMVNRRKCLLDFLKNKLTSWYLMHLQHLGLHSICWRELSMRPPTRSTVCSSDGIVQRSKNIEIYHLWFSISIAYTFTS